MEIEELRSRMSPGTKQYAERIIEMYNAPFARMLGIDIVSVSEDSAECSMDMLPEHMNSMARAHGGAVYSLMDHAFGVAANLTRDCTGSAAEIKYYRPSIGRIRAVATLINRSKSLEIFDVRAYNQDGKLVASMVCTAFAIRRERFGRPALPLLRGAGSLYIGHLPQMLQEDPRGARDRSEERGGDPQAARPEEHQNRSAAGCHTGALRSARTGTDIP